MSFPWFNRENYDAVKRDAPHDTDLLNTYEQWQERAAEQICRLETNRTAFKKISIDARELAVYCRTCGQDVNAVMIHAFATKVAAKICLRSARH
jgi:hypothetical protein